MAGAESQLNYRPDIDGLRAVAIVPVVLYHAGQPLFSGGFVGVDIFFVISGYLIAGIIQREISRGRFSIINFYERRARRILPALFVVIATALAAAWATSWPGDFVEISQSAIATVFFGSNIHFWRTTDYFATAAEFKPLLHTWSLAVEEQFYILFPLFLILMAQRPRRQLVALSLVFLVLSLGFGISVTATSPDAAFYLAPFRAWELLIGVLIALGAIPIWKRQYIREIAALAGMSMILFSVLAFNESTIFPGVAAAVPCVGTGLVIQAGKVSESPTIVSRFLSQRILVFVGLISYSLYLWHWPILAFTRLWLETTQLPNEWTIWCVLISVLVAVLSWHFVERPFRTKAFINRQAVFRLAVAASTIVVCLSILIIQGSGYPGRISDAALSALAGTEDVEFNRRECMGYKAAEEYCTIGQMGEEPTAILIGDSHAAALMSAIGVALKQQNKSGILASYSACPPILGVNLLGNAKWKDCDRFIRSSLSLIESRKGRIDYAILSARWSLYVTGEHASGELGDGIHFSLTSDDNSMTNPQLVEKWLQEYVNQLTSMGIQVVILGAIPEIGWDVPRTIARSEKNGSNLPSLPTIDSIAPRHFAADAMLERISRSRNVEFVPLAPLLCEPECQIVDDSRPLYVDDDHLSLHGARHVLGPKLAIVLNELIR